jgi:hypothetical protein
MSNLILDQARTNFELACTEAKSLQVVDNFTAAFTAVNVVNLLRQAMTDDVMRQVFMPLMNTKIGFLTDRTGKPNSKGHVKQLYSLDVVRDAIIDGVSIGLLPTGNQMNIIADRMYPTKEGYTALLRKLGVKYIIDVSYDKSQTNGFAEIPCKISYEYNKEKASFTITATVKKDDYSSPDQLRGKADRRAKKALYEYVTGCDFGDADASEFTESKDVTAEEKLKHDLQNTPKQTINIDSNQIANAAPTASQGSTAPSAPNPAPTESQQHAAPDPTPETPSCFA